MNIETSTAEWQILPFPKEYRTNKRGSVRIRFIGLGIL